MRLAQACSALRQEGHVYHNHTDPYFDGPAMSKQMQNGRRVG